MTEVTKIPGDWTLGLDYPTCGIDNQPCPSYFSRCDKCKDKERREKAVAVDADFHGDQEKYRCLNG